MDHCGFQVKNLDTAIKFYTEKLSFKLDYRAINEEEQEEYAFLSLGKARLELIQDLVNEYEIHAMVGVFLPPTIRIKSYLIKLAGFAICHVLFIESL